MIKKIIGILMLATLVACGPSVDPIQELALAKEDVSLQPDGELAAIFDIGSDYTDLQRDNKEKELKGKVVVWSLPVYEVNKSGSHYKIQTSSKTGLVGGQPLVGTFIELTAQGAEEEAFLANVKTGDVLTIKGKLTGDTTLRNIEIEPAILWSEAKHKQYAAAQAKPAQVAPAAKTEEKAVAKDVDETCVGAKTLFSCMTEKGKRVQFCQQGDTVTYSFGPEGAPEITLSVKNSEVMSRLWDGMGSNEFNEVYVPNGDVMYMAYTSFIHPRGDEEAVAPTAGLTVLKKGKSVAEIKCGKTYHSELEGVEFKAYQE
jgi:hypothetical protein